MVLMAIMKAMDPSWSIAKSSQHEIAASYSITCYPQHSSGLSTSIQDTNLSDSVRIKRSTEIVGHERNENQSMFPRLQS